MWNVQTEIYLRPLSKVYKYVSDFYKTHSHTIFVITIYTEFCLSWRKKEENMDTISLTPLSSV